MARGNNYLIQAAQAKQLFLTYDREKLKKKFRFSWDDAYFYPVMLSRQYRIRWETGDLEYWQDGQWLDGNTFAEVMTMLDLICDSREDRFLRGKFKNMGEFGLMFHQNLLETAKDPWAQKFQDDIGGFRRACLALNGREVRQGDAAYAVELFDRLEILLQLWLGDEEFPPNLRVLWDENAPMYIRYETMYFAKGMLLDRIGALMDTPL